MHVRLYPLLGMVLALVVLLTVIAGGVVFATQSGANAARVSATPTPPPRHHPATIFTDGMPAIPLGAGATMLTTAEVESYVKTHPFSGGPTASGQAPQIMMLQLTTSQKASQVMGGEYVGLSANALVYYVLLKGPFMVAIPVPPGEIVPPTNMVEEVFDAHTGNLLVWGIAG